MPDFDPGSFFTDSLEGDAARLCDAGFRQYLKDSGQQDILAEADEALTASGYDRLRHVCAIRWRFRQPVDVRYRVNNGEPSQRVSFSPGEQRGHAGAFTVANTGSYRYPLTPEFLRLSTDDVIDRVELNAVSDSETEIRYWISESMDFQPGGIYYGHITVDLALKKQEIGVVVQALAGEGETQTVPFNSIFEFQIFYETNPDQANRWMARREFRAWLAARGVSLDVMEAVSNAYAPDKARLLLQLLGFDRYVPQPQGGQSPAVRSAARGGAKGASGALTWREAVKGGIGRYVPDAAAEDYCRRTGSRLTGASAGNWGCSAASAGYGSAPQAPAAARSRNRLKSAVTIRVELLKRRYELEIGERQACRPVYRNGLAAYRMERGRHWLIWNRRSKAPETVVTLLADDGRHEIRLVRHGAERRPGRIGAFLRSLAGKSF